MPFGQWHPQMSLWRCPSQMRRASLKRRQQLCRLLRPRRRDQRSGGERKQWRRALLPNPEMTPLPLQTAMARCRDLAQQQHVPALLIASGEATPGSSAKVQMVRFC
mmetsp:Transcript_29435/g.83868  ORF Transcript_29435/g.83868 Transcript_29435/m.83868 type:complete len:106 (+) Transcript_29435:487-804(+)